MGLKAANKWSNTNNKYMMKTMRQNTRRLLYECLGGGNDDVQLEVKRQFVVDDEQRQRFILALQKERKVDLESH